MSEQHARSIIEEYTDNIVDGATIKGDFFITTHKSVYLTEMTSRLREIGWTCSNTSHDLDDESVFCTTRFEQN